MFHIEKRNTEEEIYKRMEIVRDELNTLIAEDAPPEIILIKSQQLDKLVGDYQKLKQ